MKKKKLFILGGPLDNQSAGIHRITYELVNALHEESHLDFDVVIIREKKQQAFPKFKQISIPSLAYIPGWRSFKLFILIPLICIFRGADYVLEPAHFGPVNLPGRIKRLTLIHDLTPILMPQFHQFFSAWLQKLFLPRILKKSHAVLTLSQSTKIDLLNYLPDLNGRIHRIPVGPSGYMSIDANQEVLDKYNIRKPYILTLGTIEPRKNISLLLNAFEALKEKYDIKHQLVIAGAYGWKHEKFDQTLKDHPYRNDIILTSFVEDREISSLIKYADLNVSCSHYEGFGIAAFEAMYIGQKTILPKHSSFLETGASFATFFENDSLDDLVEKTVKLLGESESTTVYPKKDDYTWKKGVIAMQKVINGLND